MISKPTILFLVAILFFANTRIVSGQSDALAGDQRIKTRVSKIGTGKRVTVSLKDGTEVRGTISQIHEDSFDVTLEKQAQSSVITYRDVDNVRKRGWSNTAKVTLGVGAGVAVIFVVVWAVVSKSTNF